MKKEYIIDSMTIRDFSSIGLLESVTRLGLTLSTIADDRYRHLYSSAIFGKNIFEPGKIDLIELSPDDLLRAVELGFEFPGLMLEDHSALFVARHPHRALITSDPVITGVARILGITVCNYVWLLFTMSKARIITADDAWRKHLELVQRVSPLALSRMSHDFNAESKYYKNKPA